MTTQALLKLKPTKGRVLLKLDRMESEKNGIILPNAEDQVQSAGTIVASQNSDLPIGTKVWIESSGIEIQPDDSNDTYTLIQEEEIMCIVEE